MADFDSQSVDIIRFIRREAGNFFNHVPARTTPDVNYLIQSIFVAARDSFEIEPAYNTELMAAVRTQVQEMYRMMYAGSTGGNNRIRVDVCYDRPGDPPITDRNVAVRCIGLLEPITAPGGAYYLFTGVPNGTYMVSVSVTGFEPREQKVSVGQKKGGGGTTGKLMFKYKTHEAERNDAAGRIRLMLGRKPKGSKDAIVHDIYSDLAIRHPHANQGELRKFVSDIYDTTEKDRNAGRELDKTQRRDAFRTTMREEATNFLSSHGYTPDNAGARQFLDDHPKGDPLRDDFKEHLRESRGGLRRGILREPAYKQQQRDIRMAERRVARDKTDKESGIAGLHDRVAHNRWGFMPSLKTPNTSSGRIIAIAIWTFVGLIFAAIIGNPLFVFAFLCWAGYQLFPGVRDVRGIEKFIQERVERTRGAYQRRLRDAHDEDERANIIREREVALKDAEMIYAADLEQLRMGWTMGGSMVFKEIFKITGWLLFALSFLTSSLPFAKPLGVVIMIIAYFAVGYSKTPATGEDRETERAVRSRRQRGQLP